jgi:hypothetical protein
MNISDSVEYKKKFLTIYSHGMAGYSRDQRGIVLKWAGYSGILAGYLKYWRPNLPKSVIATYLRFHMDIQNTKTPNLYKKWGFKIQPCQSPVYRWLQCE